MSLSALSTGASSIWGSASSSIASSGEFALNQLRQEISAAVYDPFVELAQPIISQAELNTLVYDASFEMSSVYSDLSGSVYSDLYLNAADVFTGVDELLVIDDLALGADAALFASGAATVGAVAASSTLLIPLAVAGAVGFVAYMTIYQPDLFESSITLENRKNAAKPLPTHSSSVGTNVVASPTSVAPSWDHFGLPNSILAQPLINRKIASVSKIAYNPYEFYDDTAYNDLSSWFKTTTTKARKRLHKRSNKNRLNLVL